MKLTGMIITQRQLVPAQLSLCLGRCEAGEGRGVREGLAEWKEVFVVLFIGLSICHLDHWIYLGKVPWECRWIWTFL
jgi:hypothetical protein